MLFWATRLPGCRFTGPPPPCRFFSDCVFDAFLHPPFMTVALSATTPATFEIKSANLPLVALLLKSADLTALAQDMALRFGDIPDFFDNDALVIDLAPLQGAAIDTAQVIDFASLLSLLRGYRLQPIAVKGGSPAQMVDALAAGLLNAPDAHLAGHTAKADKADKADRADRADKVVKTPAKPLAAAPAAPQAAAAHPGALVIDKPLRSGQQVYARGRDLVVLSMVNAGAEVIADGHIHVYAPLRGKAMAGARGNPDARIFALAMEAELLSIAGVYRTAETPLPASVLGKPTQVRLTATPDGDKLVMEPLA